MVRGTFPANWYAKMTEITTEKVNFHVLPIQRYLHTLESRPKNICIFSLLIKQLILL